MKACPHCGAVLPDEASFCPSCAKSVIIREKARRRKRLPAKAVFVFFAALAAALLAVFIWSLPPKTHDNGTAEALYDMKGRTYQLCIAWADTPTIPFSDRYASAAVNSDSRYPSLLFINDACTGEDAAGEFLPQVERITAEFASLSPGGGQGHTALLHPSRPANGLCPPCRPASRMWIFASGTTETIRRSFSSR